MGNGIKVEVLVMKSFLYVCMCVCMHFVLWSRHCFDQRNHFATGVLERDELPGVALSLPLFLIVCSQLLLK